MIGDIISIYLGGCQVTNGVFTYFLHGRICGETAKAVQILPDGASKERIWLPRKALLESGHSYFKLARWFKASAWQERIFTRYGHDGGICA